MNTHARARTALAVAASLSSLTFFATSLGATSSASTTRPLNSANAKDSSDFSILLTTEDSQTPALLQTLAKGACAPEAAAQPLSLQQTPGQVIDSKIQLLASQNALPLLYAADNPSIEPSGDLYKKGDVLNIATALKKLGVGQDMTQLAKSTEQAQFQGTIPSIPFQMNIEGLFYNKAIFNKYGITIPTTFTQLLADAAKLKAAGVTPFSAAGSTGWTISRWVGILLFRELGPTALQLVADKKAKLTNPKYMWAAEQVAQMGKDGYFSQGITGLSYNAAIAQFLTGGSAMMYMGSWLLAQINSSENTQGNKIGFMPFPAVSGGKGSIGQYPANTGSPNVINPHVYGPHSAAWLKCIAQNDGSTSLKDQGVFSGFRTNAAVSGLSPITRTIQHTIVTNKARSVLWFEALFGLKANDDASGNAAALVTGAMSPQKYMGILQADQSQP